MPALYAHWESLELDVMLTGQAFVMASFVNCEVNWMRASLNHFKLNILKGKYKVVVHITATYKMKGVVILRRKDKVYKCVEDLSEYYLILVYRYGD